MYAPVCTTRRAVAVAAAAAAAADAVGITVCTCRGLPFLDTDSSPRLVLAYCTAWQARSPLHKELSCPGLL